MLKWVSLSRVGGKGNSSNKKDRKAFKTGTLPLAAKDGDHRNNILDVGLVDDLQTTSTSSFDIQSLRQDISSIRDSFDQCQDDPGIVQEEDCTLGCSPGSSKRCLLLRKKIHREERLRDGAERLLGIVRDAKVRIKILGELNSTNIKLQTLRTQHAELAVSLEDVVGKNLIASSKKCYKLPMLCPELKEVKKTQNFFELIKMCLRSHYYEDADDFLEEFQSLGQLRRKCSGPRLDASGLESLFRYYNQLYYLERRFFADDPAYNNINNALFQWYDSFTGLKSCQNSVSFEKGCLLFNIGVLFAKIAIRERKSGVSDAGSNPGFNKDYFLRASGAFRHLKEKFHNAPSCDLQWSCTEMLTDLMVLQRHEALVEDEFAACLDFEADSNVLSRLSQYASFLSQSYSKIGSKLMALTSISRLWCDLVDCKQFYYDSLSRYFAALICERASNFIQVDVISPVANHTSPPMYDSPAPMYSPLHAKMHLASSLTSLESAIRLSKNHIKLQFALQQPFRNLLQKVANKRVDVEEVGCIEASELLFECPSISANPDNDLKPIPPDFNKYKVEDIFKRLGCLSIFSAQRRWTCPRVAEMHSTGEQELGFSISNDSPPIVAFIEPSSQAAKTSMKVGDFIVALNGIDVKWTPHAQVIEMIKSSKNNLSITIITPVDTNFINSEASQEMKTSLSSITVVADDTSTVCSQYDNIKINGADSCSDVCKVSLCSEMPQRNSKILSVTRSNSLSRSFKTQPWRTPTNRQEIINTDNVVIVERN